MLSSSVVIVDNWKGGVNANGGNVAGLVIGSFIASGAAATNLGSNGAHANGMNQLFFDGHAEWKNKIGVNSALYDYLDVWDAGSNYVEKM